MPCGTSSPAARQWHISEWPTIFVLDEQGYIRHRGNDEVLGGEVLGETVRALLGDGSTP